MTLPTTKQIPKPISLSLKESEGKQESSSLLELSFIKKLLITSPVIIKYIYISNSIPNTSDLTTYLS